jgi:hypothetical protein
MIKLVRKHATLGAVLGVLAVLGAGPAGAATVTVTPSGAKTFTTLPSTTVRLTLGATSVTFRGCSATATWSSTSGTLPLPFSPPTSVLSPGDNTKGNFALTCTGCATPGACTFTCDGRANVLALAVTSGSQTSLRITGIRCTISTSGACTGTLASASAFANDGGVNAIYDNAMGTLSLQPTGQNLGSWGPRTCGFPPTGVARLTSGTGGAVPLFVSPATTVVVV